MHTEDIEYKEGDQCCVGFLAYDDTHTGPRKTVMIAPAFEGRIDLMCEHAKRFAEKGYAAFVMDVYGDKQTADTLEDCMQFITPFFNNRQALQNRVNAAFDCVKNLEVVDAAKIGAFGFCFGGLCVLDLARSGADVKGVVSVHGVLDKAADVVNQTITSKVLALHGYLDPQISTASLDAFMQEMRDAHVDWQLHYFGDAKHAFTDPKAAEIGPPDMGREFNQRANDRSFRIIDDFLAECLT